MQCRRCVQDGGGRNKARNRTATHRDRNGKTQRNWPRDETLPTATGAVHTLMPCEEVRHAASIAGFDQPTGAVSSSVVDNRVGVDNCSRERRMRPLGTTRCSGDTRSGQDRRTPVAPARFTPGGEAFRMTFAQLGRLQPRPVHCTTAARTAS